MNLLSIHLKKSLKLFRNYLKMYHFLFIETPSAKILLYKRRQNMTPYIHKVQYYETDKMGITHHSNYVRWMEEARIDYMEKIGWSYDRMEKEGTFSPVLAIDCKYKESTTFADDIIIHVFVKECGPVRMTLAYEMSKTANNHLVFSGTSQHCFLNKSGTPIRLNRDCPEFYQALQALIVNQENQ